MPTYFHHPPAWKAERVQYKPRLSTEDSGLRSNGTHQTKINMEPQPKANFHRSQRVLLAHPLDTKKLLTFDTGNLKSAYKGSSLAYVSSISHEYGRTLMLIRAHRLA